MSVGTYSPRDIELIVAGVPIRGYMSGTFISTERNADSFSLDIGADGEAARTASADRSGRITLTLQQTSPSNDFLSGLIIADELTSNAVFPVLLKDTQGRTLEASACAWLVKPANTEYSDEQSGREWMIECANLTKFVGGNS